MKTRFILLSFSLFLCAVVTAAQDKPSDTADLSAKGKVAFDTLFSAKRFEDSYIGYAGEPSRLVAAYKQLLSEPNRVSAFKALTEKATKAGQLYGLVGLFEADHEYFSSILDRFRKDQTEVDTLFGCVGRTLPVSHIVFRDDPNTIRLESAYQPFDEWRGKAHLEGGFYVDIAGGGYSLFFRGHDLQRPN